MWMNYRTFSDAPSSSTTVLEGLPPLGWRTAMVLGRSVVFVVPVWNCSKAPLAAQQVGYG
jgi:hypothetical protein